MSIFLVFIVAIGWAFSQVYGSGIFYIAIAFALIMNIFSYWYSDKVTLAVSGAKEIQEKDDPELYHTVENLAITAGLPTPKVYMMQDPSPNAFATGRDPKHAVVCVTSGLRSKMTQPELEGVIAHEMSHVGNYDTRLMTIVVTLVGSIVLISHFFLRVSFFGGGRRDNNGGNNQLFLIIGIVLAILSPIAATLIQLAISRQREYLADASGALLTRYPEGLASALKKIEADDEPLAAANGATAHLYISDPLKAHSGTKQGLFSGLFDTHPPIQERIKRLNEMAGQPADA
jgi:heat shock protein HtpX